MNVYAVDFETSYEQDRDIKSLGVVGYLRHPATDVYLVSIVGLDLEYVGPPEGAPWGRIAGCQWVSHNMSFDRAVYDELRRRGIGRYPAPPAAWDCTADMVAGLQCKRSLKDAMKLLEGVILSKKVRDDMKGVRWADLTDAGKQVVGDYALGDSRHCLTLWQKYSGNWPEFERQLSRHTAAMGHRGIAVDVPRIASGIEHLSQVLFEIEKLIPWVGEVDEKGKDIPVTSSKAIIRQCASLGIPAPASTDVKSHLWERWEAEYSETAPFVKSIQSWRKVNKTLTILNAMRTRTVDGICYYELKMCGAPHTRRWSGGFEREDSSNSKSASLSIHNLPKEAIDLTEICRSLKIERAPENVEVDVRRCFVPRPGHKFVISDLSQIEARVILWIAGEEAILAPLRSGADLYDSYSRQALGYRDPRPLAEVDKGLRQLAKTHWLGLGYGMSAGKLADTARKYGFKVSTEEAERSVATFRRGVPRIEKNIWNPLKSALARHHIDKQLIIALPSGRQIQYFDVRKDGFGYCGVVERGASEKNLWYGLLTENMVQGTARDLLGTRILEMERQGFPLVAHIHDETVNEVPEADADEQAAEINQIMSTAPDWAEGLPVASGTDVTDYYCKK